MCVSCVPVMFVSCVLPIGQSCAVLDQLCAVLDQLCAVLDQLCAVLDQLCAMLDQLCAVLDQFCVNYFSVVCSTLVSCVLAIISYL